MILFINVIITDVRRFSHVYPRYGLAHHDKLDVFKYTLASYSCVEWSKIIIYCHLHGRYENKQDDLEHYIYSLFPEEITTVHPFRNKTGDDWRKASEEVSSVPDEVIFFMCNHDHVLVDYDLSMLYEAEDKLASLQTPASCFFSHWPEAVRFAGKARATDWDRFFKFNWVNSDSMQLINKKLFYQWWFTKPLKGIDVTRTDRIFNFPITTIVPKREIVRHFDGYGHSMHVPGWCPPLEIPPGFWINDIKIAYCYYKQVPHYVNIHPFKSLKTVAGNVGVDYNYMIEDIPLFWRCRISKISQCTQLHKNEVIKKRNNNILAPVTNPIQYANRTDWPLMNRERYWPAMRQVEITLI